MHISSFFYSITHSFTPSAPIFHPFGLILSLFRPLSVYQPECHSGILIRPIRPIRTVPAPPHSLPAPFPPRSRSVFDTISIPYQMITATYPYDNRRITAMILIFLTSYYIIRSIIYYLSIFAIFSKYQSATCHPPLYYCR